MADIMPKHIASQFYTLMLCVWGHAVAQLVEALRHKSEGRGFDSQMV